MKNVQVNWEKLSHKLSEQQKIYNEAPESYKDQIENLMISYIDGSDYHSMIESFTTDPDKQELILIELHEYYNLFFLDNICEIDDEYYKKNIFRIINN